MPSAVKTTLTELSDSRVRLQVEVPAAELQGRLERKAGELARELKLPGFRRGKVPAPLVIQRVGRESLLEEAVRDTLSSWYSDAIETAGIVPVGDPQLDLGELPGAGQALEFSIEIGVLPKAELGDYDGTEVPRREPAVGEEQIEAEIEAMRERLARLQTAERPASEGDFAVVDYVGTLAEQDGSDAGRSSRARRAAAGPAAQGRDQLIELGAGKLIAGFEEGLIGASAGEQRTLELAFPAAYPDAQIAGRAVSFEVAVKEVKAKQLPPVDDELAIDAGFDTLVELRDDIRRRLLVLDEDRIEVEFRQAALDAAVANAHVGLTDDLINARAREMWERMLHSLSHRGITREAYLKIVDRSEQQVLDEMAPSAELALRREAVLSALVDAEGISVADAELEQAVAESAGREGIDPAELLAELRSGGRIEDLREDLAARKAVELLATRAAPISPERAHAREKLWTPEHERGGDPAGLAASGGAARPPAASAAGAGRLWTPTDPGSAS